MQPVKTDTVLLAMAREELVQKLSHRLAPTVSADGFIDGFVDEKFVERWGTGLHRLTNAALVGLALTNLIETVRAQPENRTGIALFDDGTSDAEIC